MGIKDGLEAIESIQIIQASEMNEPRQTDSHEILMAKINEKTHQSIESTIDKEVDKTAQITTSDAIKSENAAEKTEPFEANVEAETSTATESKQENYSNEPTEILITETTEIIDT